MMLDQHWCLFIDFICEQWGKPGNYSEQCRTQDTHMNVCVWAVYVCICASIYSCIIPRRLCSIIEFFLNFSLDVKIFYKCQCHKKGQQNKYCDQNVCLCVMFLLLFCTLMSLFDDTQWWHLLESIIQHEEAATAWHELSHRTACSHMFF